VAVASRASGRVLLVTTLVLPRARPSGSEQLPDVSVVIVSYNTKALLDACLHSLFASARVSLEVFVVDNASPDGSADHVAKIFPAVTLVRNAENRGFAAANNLAIPQTRGRHVLLLNPDTCVRPDTVATLAAFLDADPDVGITGPRVLNADGTLQSCGYWYPTLRDEILLSRNVRRFGRLLLGEPAGDPGTTGATRVDWVDGCCLMIRRRAIEDIGLLDEQYFLYAEELDWCRTARKAGWQIATCPSAEMTHLRGQSSDQVKAPALALLIETRLRYYHKQDGLLAALLVSAVYALGCARRWRAEPEKSHAKMRGVRRWWQALRGAAPATRHRPAVAMPPLASRDAG
jgi:GT2 family glycosyltransferase